MRLIDADELKELFREVIGGIAKKPEIQKDLEHMIRASAMTIQMIDDAPTIEAEPVRRGKWETRNEYSWYSIYCSVCGKWQTSRTKYCPDCGAKMEVNDETD